MERERRVVGRKVETRILGVVGECSERRDVSGTSNYVVAIELWQDMRFLEIDGWTWHMRLC